MTKRIIQVATAAALAALALATGCTDTSTPNPAPDAGSGSQQPPAFRQVEQLARPGINEALLITTAFIAGYNATAPTFAGVPSETLNAVVGEAKTVLQAIYLGACLINGVLKLTPDTGVKPAAIKCHAVGADLWLADGVTLTAASKAAAKAYADKVFDQFIPDVMRVDTSVTSSYLTPCGSGPDVLNAKPLLCGGRFLSDDTIDVTYDYLLNGAANYLTPGDGGATDQQVIALTSDGVAFLKDASPLKNPLTLSKPDTANLQQFHPDVSPDFPYSANPF